MPSADSRLRSFIEFGLNSRVFYRKVMLQHIHVTEWLCFFYFYRLLHRWRLISLQQTFREDWCNARCTKRNPNHCFLVKCCPLNYGKPLEEVKCINSFVRLFMIIRHVLQEHVSCFASASCPLLTRLSLSLSLSLADLVILVTLRLHPCRSSGSWTVTFEGDHVMPETLF